MYVCVWMFVFWPIFRMNFRESAAAAASVGQTFSKSFSCFTYYIYFKTVQLNNINAIYYNIKMELVLSTQPAWCGMQSTAQLFRIATVKEQIFACR